MVFDLAMLHPRRKPPQLAVITIVRHPHLRADEEDLSVVNNNTAVVDDVLVNHRPVDSPYQFRLSNRIRKAR